MRKQIQILGVSGILTAAVVSLMVVGIQTTQPEVRIQAAEPSQDAKKAPILSSIHIKGRLRTEPGNNFCGINAEIDFVPFEVWKQFGKQEKWRVEKPERVIVMNGATTVMLIKPNLGCKIPYPTNGAYDSGELLSLADMPDHLAGLLESGSVKGPIINITRQQDKDGEKIVVTVETKPQISTDEEMKNKTFYTSNTRRIFRFNAATKQLETVQIYLHEKDKDVLILEADSIDCNQTIDPAIFSLTLPKDVMWAGEVQKLPDNEKYEKMTPKDTALAFFEACSKENWDEVQKFMSPLTENTKKSLGGLQVISVGVPFQAKPYGGWFVPYEIKFKDKDGTVKKWKLALRNDNPAKRYVVDGGI